MNHSVKVGFSFGTASGIITTLGLMVGLHAGTHSKLAVLGGIITIAIADAFSDALGIHISEESEEKHKPQEIWQSTIATFLSKFICASLFIMPVLIFDLWKAIVVSVIFGLVALAVISFIIAKRQHANPWPAVFEHLVIASIVITITHLVGDWVAANFQ